jgi:hypothetical protein
VTTRQELREFAFDLGFLQERASPLALPSPILPDATLFAEEDTDCAAGVEDARYIEEDLLTVVNTS